MGWLDGPIPDEISSAETYGALKALCERAALEAMPGRALVVRPGLIAGPRDPTARFTYWPRRIAEGGRVLAPRPEQHVQFIDVRDLAEWILESVERGLTGTYNATGPAEPLTMALSEGLRFRPLAETIADTLSWDRARARTERAEHLPRARERQLLERLP